MKREHCKRLLKWTREDRDVNRWSSSSGSVRKLCVYNKYITACDRNFYLTAYFRDRGSDCVYLCLYFLRSGLVPAIAAALRVDTERVFENVEFRAPLMNVESIIDLMDEQSLRIRLRFS